MQNRITRDKNGENVLYLEITEVALVRCNIANNDYKQDSRVFHTFVTDKLFDSLLEIPPTNFIFLKTFNLKFLYIEQWFTDQNGQPSRNRINLTLLIK